MLGVIGNKFSIGKETYNPFSVELHYFRIDKRYWSICFERIKRAGFRILATAVPWNIHQQDSRFVDFQGISDPKRDLIVFLELAREFGFKVILRPGPWVGGQLPNGGLPEFIYHDIKVFARDTEGKEIEIENQQGVKGGYLPSYLHSNFQFQLRNYFKAFIETTKNYVHPRGPVFMVELDYETSFGRMLDPGSADFNPDVLAAHFPPFLEARYEDIKKLNTRYREKNSGFADVEPPHKFQELTSDAYPKVLDWFYFREHMLRKYLEVLEDMFKSYTVEPLFFRSLYFAPGELLPAFNLVPDDRAPFLGSNVFPEGDYFDLTTKGRFLRAEYGFGFASSFTSGRAARDPKRQEEIAPVTNNQRRFFLAAGLSSGFKGLNHYMFVDRDHWYGAPLHSDGTVSDGYEMVKNFNNALSTIGFEEMVSSSDIAVLVNRMYYWLGRIDSKKDFAYIRRLMYQSASGFARDLLRLNLDFGIRENREFEDMKKYKLIFAPVTEVMPERDQEALVELARSGVTLVLCGVMPKYDENLKDCTALSNYFRIKTTVDNQIGTITHKFGSYPGYIYGSIRTTDDGKVKKTVTSGAKTIGVCSSRFKGNLHFFSFDIASGGDHVKLAFLESILQGEKLQSHTYCSDPSASVTVQMGPKKGLLVVTLPPRGELSDSYEPGEKEVIIRVELKKFGFTGTRVKLTNLLSEAEEPEVIKSSVKELQDGISLQMHYPDGAIYLVEKRP